MVDLLVSLVALLVLVAVVLLALGAVTVLPMVLTIGRAERRGLDPDLWGAISLGCSVVALAAAAVLRDNGVVTVVPVVASWAGFLLVHRFGREGAPVPGAHR